MENGRTALSGWAQTVVVVEGAPELPAPSTSSAMKLMLLVSLAFLSPAPLLAQPPGGNQAVGDVHMDVTCSPSVAADFDVALALLHNFWYARALDSFNKIIQADPQCAMAYWGAAMTYNHPFWDPPTNEDLSAAWALVQKGLAR